jgi:leucine dehydrogenase
MSMFEPIEVPRLLVLSDPPSGLRAFIAIDDLTLGPAAGGVRTRAYQSEADAIRDASRLARAMTVKCALAGLDAGGGKAVVLEHPGLDRRRAFEKLGAFIEELGGLFRTAGDLGTTVQDLEAISRRTQFVHQDDRGLAEAAARGLLHAIEACADLKGRSFDSLEIAIQGAGAIGSAAARVLKQAGARVRIADLDPFRAHAAADAIGAEVVSASEILSSEVDVLAPCAVGGVIDAETAERVRAFAVCGAANNALADAKAAEVLRARGILHVPDPIASAGAVIEGIGRSVMGLSDPTPLIQRIRRTAREVLEEALRSGRTPQEVAEERARLRLEKSAQSPM